MQPLLEAIHTRQIREIAGLKLEGEQIIITQEIVFRLHNLRQVALGNRSVIVYCGASQGAGIIVKKPGGR